MKQIFILPFCLSFLFINTLYSKTEAKTTPNNKTTQETQDTNNNTQTNSLTIKLIFNRKSSTPPLWHLNFGISTPISEAQLQYEGKIPDMDFYYQYDSKHITKTESSITFDMMINDKTPNIIFSIPGIEEGWILKPKDSETIYQAINKYNVKEIKLTLENLKCIKRDEQKTLYTIKTTKKYIFFGKINRKFCKV